jgi:hypothetical protein
MFALFLTGLLGVLGLATDVGFYLQAKRAAQNAADAGALAGARHLVKWTSTSHPPAIGEVTELVAANGFGTTIPSVFECVYINDGNGGQGNCSNPVPEAASGIRVKTRITVPTFFMRIFPGVPDTLIAKGHARARVQRAADIIGDSPFIICGTGAWDVTGDPTVKNTSYGSLMPILSSTSPVTIDPAAVGKIFRVHDNQLDKKGTSAGCESKANRFKGLGDGNANKTKTVPAWFDYETGTKSGPTRSKVNGTNGCNAGVDDPYNCVMLIPIAVDDPEETENSKQVYVVGYAAFEVTTVDSNSHNAKLLDDYIITGKGANGWVRGSGGVTTIRLNW